MRILAIALACVFSVDAIGQVPTTDNSTHYLAPRQFRNLPSVVIDSLQGHGCRVPQTDGATGRNNVVAGAFTGAHRREWAVLCSVRDTAEIVIVSAESGRITGSIGRSADVAWVQSVGGGRWSYARQVTALSLARIRRWRRDDDGRRIPTPNHDAINDAFVGKGSSAYYYADGHWYRRSTSD